MDNSISKRDTIIVKSIKEIFFSYKEEFVINDPLKLVKLELYHTLGINVEHKHAKFMLGVIYHYIDKEDKLVEMQLNNIFELPQMDKYEADGNNIILPGEILLDIIRESIAHARALLSLRLSGTLLAAVVIPFEDTLPITNFFFPDLIRNKEGNISSVKGKLED